MSVGQDNAPARENVTEKQDTHGVSRQAKGDEFKVGSEAPPRVRVSREI